MQISPLVNQVTTLNKSRVGIAVLLLMAMIAGQCTLLFALSLAKVIPKNLEGVPLKLSFKIRSPVTHAAIADNFIAEVIEPPISWPTAQATQLALAYDGKRRQSLQQGDEVSALVKLKQPHAPVNFVGSIYEQRAKAQHQSASGYIKQIYTIEPAATTTGNLLSKARKIIAAAIRGHLPEQATRAIVLALVLGDTSELDAATWTALQRTGTSHLVAISGLHIGLVAGMVLFVGRRLVDRLCSTERSQALWGTLFKVAAVLTAAAYAKLSGMAIPTERALLLLVMATVVGCFKLQASWLKILMLCALAVIAYDPQVIYAASFYLSFFAVLLLLLLGFGRLVKLSWWRQLIWMQFAIVVGLLPLTAYWFGQISLVAIGVNLLAVPLVSLCILPLSLLATLASLLLPAVVTLLWQLDALMIKLLLAGLLQISAWPFSAMVLPITWTTAVLWQLSCLPLLLPSGFPGRQVILSALLFMVVPKQHVVAQGELSALVIDVGQGLSVLVTTSRHQLLYDAGPIWPTGDDAGRRYVSPAVASSALRKLDRIVISHSDADHSGGLNSILSQYPPDKLYSSRKLPGHKHALCAAGSSWHWDGVDFKFIHPQQPLAKTASTNTASCVLLISTKQHKLLLTGDIDSAAERELVAHYGRDLASAVLVAPHHGSSSSSSMRFIAAVAPQWVIIAAGYLNRYHLPSPAVVKRYLALGSQILNTADLGAIKIQFKESKGIIFNYARVTRGQPLTETNHA